MIFNFWNQYESFIHYDTALQFDYRLDNIILKLNSFFQRLLVNDIEKENICFYLAGSCMKADTYRYKMILINSFTESVLAMLRYNRWLMGWEQLLFENYNFLVRMYCKMNLLIQLLGKKMDKESRRIIRDMVKIR